MAKNLKGFMFKMQPCWGHALVGMDEASYKTPILVSNTESQTQRQHHRQLATCPLHFLCNPQDVKFMES